MVRRSLFFEKESGDTSTAGSDNKEMGQMKVDIYYPRAIRERLHNRTPQTHQRLPVKLSGFEQVQVSEATRTLCRFRP